MRKLLIIAGLALLVYVAVGGFVKDKDAEGVPGSQAKTTQSTTQAFNKRQYSLTDPSSVWAVVNKKNPLEPINYAPSDLQAPSVSVRTAGTQVRKQVNQALVTMFAAAETAGAPLRVSSAYRSYSYQTGLYNGYVDKEGQQAADSESARPGYSEHQTGLAVDIGPANGVCNVELCFGDTDAGKWLALNAYKYGFIIRYPEGKTEITGYEYEPWHVRYVGIGLAKEMHNKNISTMEEFFALPSAPQY